MPKEKPLQGTLQFKISGLKTFGKSCIFELEWEGRYLCYQINTKKKLDLSQTTGWDVAPCVDDKKILSLRIWDKGRGRSDEILLRIPGAEFETWLYWILRSLLIHSDCPIDDEKLNGLQRKKKLKIQSKLGMKEFDKLHVTFLTVLDKVTDEDGKLPRYTKGSMPARRTVQQVWDKRSGKKGSSTQKPKLPPVGYSGEGGFRFTPAKKYLGSGAGGQIYALEGFQPTGKSIPAVIKKCLIDHREAADLIKEARLLAALGEHPNITRLIDARVTSENLCVFLERGVEDLKKRQERPLSPVQIRQIAVGILAGLDYCHAKGVYHIDIKPQNILVFNHDIPKIMDFGAAHSRLVMSKQEMFMYAGEGSNPYKPPECLADGDPDDFMSETIHLELFDSHSAGKTIARALLGARYKLEYKISKSASYTRTHTIKEFEYWSEELTARRARLSREGLKELADLVIQMMAPNRNQRLTLRQAYTQFKRGRTSSRRSRMQEGVQAIKVMQELAQREQKIGRYGGKNRPKSI